MLSVIIVTYNDPVRLRLCLHGLLRQTLRDFELIVINDGGDREINRPVYEEMRRLGLAIDEIWHGPETTDFRLAAARNTGLRRAHCERTLFIDGDCILAPNVLAEHATYGSAPQLVAGARKHLPAHCLQWLQPEQFDELDQHVVANDERYRLFGPKYVGLRNLLRKGERVIPLTSYVLVWGFQVSVPTSWARQIGGFNEEFVGYGGEDEEFAARMSQVGTSLLGRFDLISYHLDHPPRHVGKRTWLDRVKSSVARPDPVRNGGPLPGPDGF